MTWNAVGNYGAVWVPRSHHFCGHSDTSLFIMGGHNLEGYLSLDIIKIE